MTTQFTQATLRRSWTFASLLLIFSCGSESNGPRITTVAITPGTALLRVTHQRALAVEVLDEDGTPVTGADVLWTSRTPAVASVSPAGVVTAVGPGVDTITATVEDVSGMAVITVTAVPVDSVVVTPAVPAIESGETVQLSASPRDSTGAPLAGRTTTWQSSAPSVATVSSTGLVTGVDSGMTTITATSEGQQTAVSVTVAPAAVVSIQLLPAGDTVQVGDTVKVVVIPKDARGAVLTGRPTVWGLSDSTVFQPIPGGRFIAQAAGTVTLSATVGGIAKTGEVAVQSCGDTLQFAIGSFTFPLIAGGLASHPSAVVAAGDFNGVPAWYGGGVIYGVDSASMVVAYEPSTNLGRGVADAGICLVTSGATYHYARALVKPKAGLPGPSGLRVVQESFVRNSASADSAFILFRYTFTNLNPTAMVGLRVGYAVDWDVGNDPSANYIVYNATHGVHQAVAADSLVHPARLAVIGFRSPGAIGTSRGWLNGADPTTREAYYGVLASGTAAATSGPMDIRALAGAPAFTVPAYGRYVVYFIVVGGTTQAKFTTSLAAAKAAVTTLGY